MSLRDLTDLHLRALHDTATSHGWTGASRSVDIGHREETEAVASNAGAATLRLLRLWEAQREDAAAEEAYQAAIRRKAVARRRLDAAYATYGAAQASSPQGAQAWQP